MASAPAAPPQLPPPPVWNCGGIVGIDMPTVWWSQEDEGLAITVCFFRWRKGHVDAKQWLHQAPGLGFLCYSRQHLLVLCFI